MHKLALIALLTIGCATNSFASRQSRWLEDNPNSASAHCYDLVNAMSPNTPDLWILDQTEAMYQFYDVCSCLYFEESMQLKIIDSRFGAQEPETYELDYFEKCQLMKSQFETDALLKDACDSI